MREKKGKTVHFTVIYELRCIQYIGVIHKGNLLVSFAREEKKKNSASYVIYELRCIEYVGVIHKGNLLVSFAR